MQRDHCGQRHQYAHFRHCIRIRTVSYTHLGVYKRQPKGYIKGKVGAGDAFCAGVLYGIYQGWDCSTCLRLGGAAAAANLSAPDSISGMRPVEQLWSLEQQFKKDTCR